MIHRAKRRPKPAAAGAFALALAAAFGCGQATVSPTPIATVSASSSAASPAGSASVAAPPSASVAPSGSCTSEAIEPAELPWWNERVFYEVFVRSFQDSDGDGIGDLRGLIDRLDYLNDGDPGTTDDLGVTGIWLMPVAESPSYHGYDVADYRAIEADYGTVADFRALIAAAHARGIAVIVDLVMNHTSRQHPWFEESRTAGSRHADWYLWEDERPSVSREDGAPVWHDLGGRYYYGYFGAGMPDLHLAEPAVTRELDDVARFWVEDLGVDGFRLDAIKHLMEDGSTLENVPASRTWLEGFHDRLEAVDRDALLVGEVFDASIVSAQYVPDAVDLTFNFELAGKTLLAARTGDGDTLASAQAGALERYRGRHFGSFLTNHDQPRVATTLSTPGMLRMAASALLTGPGVPFLYYGEEIGLTGTKPDERIRTPMPWDAAANGGFTTAMPWEPLETGWEQRNIAAQARDEPSLLAHYRRLVHLRNAVPQLRAGTWRAFQPQSGAVYAFAALDPAGGVAVVMNMGDEAVDGTLSTDGPALCRLRAGEVLLADGYARPPTPAAIDPPQAGSAELTWRPVAELPPHSTLVVRLSP